MPKETLSSELPLKCGGKVCLYQPDELFQLEIKFSSTVTHARRSNDRGQTKNNSSNPH